MGLCRKLVFNVDDFISNRLTGAKNTPYLFYFLCGQVLPRVILGPVRGMTAVRDLWGASHARKHQPV